MAAVSFAAGAAALTAPAAHASTEAQAAPGISIVDTVQDLQTSGMPAEYRKQVPTVAQQLGGLNNVQQLHQLTDLVAPVTQLLPAVQ